MITSKTVNRKLKEYDEVIELMRSAFPQNELMPLPFLRLMALRKDIEFKAYCDGDDLIGLTYTISTDELAFVLYLAVNGKIRSKGYGSAILNAIKEDHKGKEITLNIEPLDEDAENIEQRRRRLAFYLKNGFHDTGLETADPKNRYAILSTSEELSLKPYKKTLRRLSFGFHCPKIVPSKTAP